MAKFADLVKAQRESGKGIIGSLSGAYNQQNMQKFDVRNKLFSRSGLTTSLFPGLKGYQAQPISSKAPGSMISPALSNSPTALSSIAKDAKISARNSMALPSIARNMARMVKIWGGTPAKYFDSAAEKETAKEAKFGGSGKGGGVLGKGKAGGGGIMGMLGGVGSMLGGALGSIGSVAGSILGGIGSLLGGAASGIFGVLTSALGGMGFMGILAAGAIGFVLYQIYKSLDFSSLGGGLGDAFSGIKESLSNIFGKVDDATGGKLGKFIDEVKDTFKSTVNKIAAGLDTAINLFKDMGIAVLQDMYGFMMNLFQENKGKILGMIAIGAMGAMGGFSTLTGAAVSLAVAAAMAAYGKMTGEKSIEEAQSENSVLREELKKVMKEGKQVATYDEQGNVTGYETAGQRASDIEDKIKENDALIKKKQDRTSNTQGVIGRFTAENIGNEYRENLNTRQYNQTSQQFPTSPTPVGVNKKASISHQDAMNYLMSKGGYTKQQAAGIVANLHAESGMNSAVVAPGEGSFGLAQWNPKSGRLDDLKKFAKERGKPESDPYVQLDFLMEELKNKSTYGDKDLRMASTAQDAAMIFQRKYERPKNISDVRASIASSLVGESGSDGSGSQIASVDSKPSPAPSASTSSTPPAGKSSLLASLASPLEMLDKYTGGALGLGSVKVADMLRDLGNEAMDNPMFIDNSVNTSGGNDRAMATTASVWDQNILDTILNQRTT